VKRVRTPGGAIVAVLPLLAVIAGGVLLVRHNEKHASQPPPTGPIVWGTPDSLSWWVYPQRSFYYGHPVLVNWDSHGKDAVLEGVSLNQPTPGLRIVERHSFDPTAGISVANASVFPLPNGKHVDLQPFVGATVAASPSGDRSGPSIGIALVLAVDGTRTIYRTNGLVLRYRVGSTNYRMVVYDLIQVCVSDHAEQSPGTCPTNPNLDAVPPNSSGSLS
jgi:hypothetical protein